MRCHENYAVTVLCGRCSRDVKEEFQKLVKELLEENEYVNKGSEETGCTADIR